MLIMQPVFFKEVWLDLKQVPITQLDYLVLLNFSRMPEGFALNVPSS